MRRSRFTEEKIIAVLKESAAAWRIDYNTNRPHSSLAGSRSWRF